MGKIAFVGFGEVNTPKDVIIKKCAEAERGLLERGLDLVSVYPVTDDYEENDIKEALSKLSGNDFDEMKKDIMELEVQYPFVNLRYYGFRSDWSNIV